MKIQPGWTTIIGDVHNHVREADAFLSLYEPERVIWLGDYFDCFGDGPEDAARTARWLKGIFSRRPQDVFLIGNHELPYAYPQNEHYRKWGWSPEKGRAAESVMRPGDWSRLEIVFADEDLKFLATHAGLTLPYLNGGVFEPDTLRERAVLAHRTSLRGDCAPLFMDSWGPLWNRTVSLIKGWNQISGHTAIQEPDVFRGYGPEVGINLDCAHTYVGLVSPEGAIYSLNIHNGNRKLLSNS